MGSYGCDVDDEFGLNTEKSIFVFVAYAQKTELALITGVVPSSSNYDMCIVSMFALENICSH